MLAGLVLALGVALVAVVQLQSAASQYDQRMSMARDNARAAMDIAIAELQKHAGPDRVATFTADVLRDVTTDDFNAPSNPASVTDFQPFWTGVVDLTQTSAAPVWLVTKPISSDFNPNGEGGEADPEVGYSDQVLMVGRGTSTPADADVDQSLLEVRVPREKIVSPTLAGYDSTQTIGHYAYWVGDMGVKASYALYDPLVAEDRDYAITYGIYSDAATRDRLWQLRQSGPKFPSGYGYVPEEHPDLIDAFLNDFQIRGWGHSDGATLFSDLSANPKKVYLSESEVRRSFHDFTGLSKGLLVDTEAGGFKVDLSADPVGDSLSASYQGFARLGLLSREDEGASGFRIGLPEMDADSGVVLRPLITPVITEFNLNGSLYLNGESEESYEVVLSLNTGIEVWNPYREALVSVPLEAVVDTDVPITVSWTTAEGGGVSSVVWSGRLSELIEGSGVVFPFEPDFDAEDDGSLGHWRPGQIEVFSGPSANQLEQGPQLNPDSAARLEFALGTVSLPEDETLANRALAVRFGTANDESFEGGVVVSLRLPGETEALASFSIDQPFLLDGSVVGTALLDVGVVTFGFSWAVDDAALVDEELAGGENAYRIDEVIAVGNYLQEPDALDSANTSRMISLDTSLLLAANDIDLPLLQLPMQELTSVAQLRGSLDLDTEIGGGTVGHAENHFFDRFFFSTIPANFADEGSWAPGQALPNSFYATRAGADPARLQSSESASQLYVDGAFNVHSTSIEAWAAVLSANRAGETDAWPSEDPNRYLFFNAPLSSHVDSDFSMPEDPIDKLRLSLTQGVISLNDLQARTLAKHIVAQIRERFGESGSGAFTSIRDFLDSAVLENAIVAADLELSTKEEDLIRPDWVIKNSARYFNQRTLMNYLAPYVTPRSDTFLIRAYGDAVDPTASEEVWARAYCEAIVQRTHESYLGDDAVLGRRFKVIAFRWLNPSEI